MLTLRVGTEEDLELLAKLNKQLIEDERHDNTMNIEQLKVRMRQFIRTDYNAYLFEREDEMIGYALVDHTKKPLYVRQFFICRDQRRKRYGKLAFEMLLERLDTGDVDIEVMHGNETGYAFWKSLGFIERSVYMRMKKGEF